MSDSKQQPKAPNIFLDLDGTLARFQFTKEHSIDTEKEYPGYFTARIVTDPEKDGGETLPLILQAVTSAGIITFQFTKQQAMMLGDFLQLAKYVKEPD